ncbi:MAG: hypothetical protein OS112_03310 [Methanoregula sp.]|nr:MAG: hypothetical protein OS112_03310 [Methanoregula sp.]
MVRINLNEYVKFVPTEAGKKVLQMNPYYTGLEPENPCLNEYRIPLWIFCNCFGPYMENGGNLIKENTLVIGDGNEHV